MTLVNLIPTLQLAVGPVILISGVGLILLSMTNRLGRTIDRSRLLTQELPGASGEDRASIRAQLRIFWLRARIVRTGIALAVLSALLAALLVISLFLGALFRLGVAALIVGLFVFCMICLIGALTLFIWDINLSLRALGLEMPADVCGKSEPTSGP